MRLSPEDAYDIHLTLMDSYHKGIMSIEKLTEIINRFRFIDEGQRQWCIGVTSGQWYLWSNNRWVKGYPQSKLLPWMLKMKT